MNTVLVLAGGVGQRTKSQTPKQFIEVDGKPIIIHTLEKFQKATAVDKIYVVCLETWIQKLTTLCQQYNIKKLTNIVSQGENIFQSTRNGLEIIAKTTLENPLVLIHEAVRPLITQEMIVDSYKTAKEYGNAVSATTLLDEIAYEKNNITRIFDKNIHVLQNPHTFELNALLKAYGDQKNEKLGMQGTALLMHRLGTTLRLSKGEPDNFKITFEKDIARFEALAKLYN